jgi:hypothetical protein
MYLEKKKERKKNKTVKEKDEEKKKIHEVKNEKQRNSEAEITIENSTEVKVSRPLYLEKRRSQKQLTFGLSAHPAPLETFQSPPSIRSQKSHPARLFC